MIAVARSWLEGGLDASTPGPAPITADFTAFPGTRDELIDALASKSWECVHSGDAWGALSFAALALSLADGEVAP